MLAEVVGAVAPLTDLMNRALDKPAEQVNHPGEDGGPVKVIYQWQS